MPIEIGTNGLNLSTQAPFNPETPCVKCGKKARIAFVMAEPITDNGRFITDLHHNDPGGEGFWLHDAAAFATYICTDIDCATATTLWNQA
jgi:hypothetical protein